MALLSCSSNGGQSVCCRSYFSNLEREQLTAKAKCISESCGHSRKASIANDKVSNASNLSNMQREKLFYLTTEDMKWQGENDLPKHTIKGQDKSWRARDGREQADSRFTDTHQKTVKTSKGSRNKVTQRPGDNKMPSISQADCAPKWRDSQLQTSMSTTTKTAPSKVNMFDCNIEKQTKKQRTLHSHTDAEPLLTMQQKVGKSTKKVSLTRRRTSEDQETDRCRSHKVQTQNNDVENSQEDFLQLKMTCPVVFTNEWTVDPHRTSRPRNACDSNRETNAEKALPGRNGCEVLPPQETDTCSISDRTTEKSIATGKLSSASRDCLLASKPKPGLNKLTSFSTTKLLQKEVTSTCNSRARNSGTLSEEKHDMKDNRELASDTAKMQYIQFSKKHATFYENCSILSSKEAADRTSADNDQSGLSLKSNGHHDADGHRIVRNSTGDHGASSPAQYENLRHLHDVLARKPDHEFLLYCGKSASLRHIETATVDVTLNPGSAIPRSQLVFWEIWRLSTFSALEDLAVFAIRLAQTGFYYDEELDEIQCFSCNVSKRRWSKTEPPAVVHLILSPDCDQANMRDGRNVPISKESQVFLPNAEGSAGSDKGADVLQQDSDQTDASASTQSMPSAAVDPTSAERRNLQNDFKERAVSGGPATTRDTNADGRPSEPISTAAGRLPSLPQPSAQNQTLPTQNSLVGLPSGSVASAPQVKTASPSAGPPSQNSATSSAPTVSKPLGAGEQSPSRYPVQVEQAPYATPNQHCHSHGSFEDSGVQEDNQETADGDGRPATGGLDMRRAINPAYATVSKRMATFSDWPSTGKPSSRVLVLAGFHYTGIGDSVRCFYCGVMLRNWRQNDDPWVAHVRFRFSCDYILTIKGESFVRETQVALARRQATAPQEQNEGESTSCTAQAGGNTTRAATPASAASTATTATNQNRNPPPSSTPSANTNMPRSASPSPRTTRNNSNHPDERRGAGDIGNKGKSQQGSTSSHPATTLTVDGDTAGTTTTLLPQVMSTTVAAGGQQAVTVHTALHGGNHSPPVKPGLLSSPPRRADGGGQREDTQNSRMNGENREGRMSARSELNNLDQEQYLQELQNSNRRLRQTHDCRLCRRRAVNILFLPCGHLCSCDVCATTITNCPLCDELIGGTARVSFQ